MKKGILIDAVNMGKHWVGGLYYCKNIAFVLSQNRYISEKYRIVISCRKEHRSIFSDLAGVKIVCPLSKHSIFTKYHSAFVAICYQCKILYWRNHKSSIPGVKSIAWIPDFQHKHYPEFFTEEDVKKRDDLFDSIANKNIPLVLSSFSCLNDYRRFYSHSYENVHVVPFVSYIETDLQKLNSQFIDDTMKKYGISGEYAVVMNQFWQHKNHKIVFEAMDVLFSKYPNIQLDFVFTGEMEDYRNQEYIRELKSIIDHSKGNNHINILGFISRKEQLAVMKNAAVVIQPSLFEGWGTVVEDAKVLGKTILLSDIPVHREQKNEKSRLFDPSNPESLAELIYQVLTNKQDDCDGVDDMYKRARQYSKGFEQLLTNLEQQ